MTLVFGVPIQLLSSQLMLGLMSGAFYAMLSLGLAIIFGLLGVVNFAHGAQFMLGAYCTWLLLNWLGVGYWWALILSPVIVGLVGIIIERTLIRRLYRLDHVYGLLLTFGLSLVIEGVFRNIFGSSGLPYGVPPGLTGTWNLGFMFLPIYRAWVIGIAIAVCFVTWLVIERTRIGAHLRAANENAAMVQAFGINVPLLKMVTYGVGIGLAALAGVLAAPIYSVNPQMGSSFIITVFAVVVIGGMGSIFGSVVTGFALGLIEGLTKVFYPAGASTIVFVTMIIVLLVRPEGLFGKSGAVQGGSLDAPAPPVNGPDSRRIWGLPILHFAIFSVLAACLVVAPFLFYPFFLMKLLCFGLFACAFNLLLGYTGLLSFGHAAFFGIGGYVAGYVAKAHGVTPELALLLGAASAGLLGVLFGWVAIRRQGIYFSMITLALSQMLYFFCVRASFTGGEDGLQKVPRGRLFGLIDLDSDLAMYPVVAIVFLLCLLIIYRMVHSPFGQILKATRDNESRAVSLGYRVNQQKLAAFTISAAFAGVAGALKSIVFGTVTLVDVHWAMSGEVILMTLVGGAGTIFGPMLGAGILVSMQTLLAGIGTWVSVIQGLIFILCVLALRRGVVGSLASYFKVSL